MTIRVILTEPNKILREKSLPVDKVDKDLQKLMDDMVETMYAAPGIGLAAIQVGVPKRVIVLDIAKKSNFSAPLTATAMQQFLAAAGIGLGHEDDAAVAKIYARNAGIELTKY